jgi:hypothetical protein
MASPHEARILLAIVSRRWDEAQRLVRRAAVEPGAFLALCRECDIHPWIDELVTRTGRWGLLGPAVRSGLHSMRNKVRHDNLVLLARAQQALDLLAVAGVTPIALKGLDLLHRVYDGFDQRTLTDVDLLIRPGELRPAVAALQSAGWTPPADPERTNYIRSSHHLPLRSPGPVHVEFELHWNLAQEVRFAVDDAGLQQRSLPLEIEGRRLRRLEDHDIVAHLLLHHFTHYFDRRLKWLVDLQRVTAQHGFSWAQVIQRLRRWRAVAATGAAVRHLSKMCPDLIPARALRELPVAAWRRALLLPLRSSHPLELLRHTGNRRVQLYLAAVLLERPSDLPAWLAHRRSRASRSGENPLDGPLELGEDLGGDSSTDEAIGPP